MSAFFLTLQISHIIKKVTSQSNHETKARTFVKQINLSGILIAIAKLILLATRSLPLRRNAEKWPCDVGVIKLHLQSTPHYNTAAWLDWKGYPLRLVRKKQLTTGGVDDTEKKLLLQPAAAKGAERCVLPLQPEQSLMISLVFAHQFKPHRSFSNPLTVPFRR